RERDHLAADLGEALGAALDGDEALRVDGHDVAGVVPALGRRLEYARIVSLEIAEHHVRPTHIEPPAFVDTRHRLEPWLHSGHQTPDGAELVEHRRVEREHGRGLGHAVAFEDAQPEFFHVGTSRRFSYR